MAKKYTNSFIITFALYATCGKTMTETMKPHFR